MAQLPAWITPETKVEDVVHHYPSTQQALEKLGICLCCAGTLSLKDATQAHGVQLDTALDVVAKAVATASGAAKA